MQQRTRSLPPDGTHLNIVTSSCPLTPRYWPSTKTCGTESNTDSSAWQFELLLVLLFMFDVGDRPTTAPPIVRRVSIRSLSSLWWPLSKKIPLRRQAFSHFVDNKRILNWPCRLLYRMKLQSNFGVYFTKKMEHIWSMINFQVSFPILLSGASYKLPLK